ncbi:cupin domain-containing protein [Aspergillus saccharolyticus JOP 1030-1]|uniref:Cupin 2 conserved barrel domain-containing protein n=1 Tax=Aspergillus saccharolyticus JOP 1030-1 TaxID=1450539 RepID=A0A318ZBM7_9EURO|nr:hypothetical protein BP01DRAFT_358094 [Aspergillus saccharolyticus JOP 1030-1]PYH43917.1 hypothetical protein BP01DRAFT_358094 [Aspergillus saccharolyticus JOP 1030-1]
MPPSNPPSALSVQEGFNGAIISQERHALPPLVFSFEVTFHLARWPPSLRNIKPPKHFHPYQEEYVEVLEGFLCVEVGNQAHILTPQSGQFRIPPWVNHRLYPPPGVTDGTIRFLLSGQDTAESFKLDTIFFTNWYGYQEETVVVGKRVDMIQVMCMFDAGGSYLSLPEWVPLGKRLAMGMGIVLGRWLGGFLGYRPYFERWTRAEDWPLARRRMQTASYNL